MLKHNLYTVGYTSFTTYKANENKQPNGIEAFITTLQKFSIRAVVDVRSSPYSAGYEQFNKEHLQYTLKKHQIFYLFLGEELGARPLEPSMYTSGQADFDKMCKRDKFLEGCARLYKGLDQYNICMLCAEQNPLECHRAILVANAFRNIYTDINIFHILKDKPLIAQKDLDEQVMKENNLPDLFNNINTAPLHAIVAKAYKAQAKKIAYRLEKTFQQENNPLRDKDSYQ